MNQTHLMLLSLDEENLSHILEEREKINIEIMQTFKKNHVNLRPLKHLQPVRWYV